MAYENLRLKEYKAFLCGKSASVLGLGISNAPLITFLVDCGVKVTARDSKDLDEIRKRGILDVDSCLSRGVKFVTGKNYLCGIDDDIIFKSPGLRFDSPEILSAVQNGSLLTSEMEAFISLCPSKIIAITGSDGKTTTTTLVSELLKASGKKVWLGGNIGHPLLSDIENITPDDFTVLELSSFQLHTINRFKNEDLPFSHLEFPDAAVITNISPNHLNWHTDMQEYTDAKCAVFRNMKNGAVLVTNADCAATLECSENASALGVDVKLFSHDKTTHICEKDGYITVDGQKVLKISDIKLPGRHNVENYMAAIGAVYPYITSKAITEVAKSFGGVKHRFELIKTSKNSVAYYNSSIDSSPTRTLAALGNLPQQYDKKIIIILGGSDKGLDFSLLAKAVCKKAHTALIYQDTPDNKIMRAISSCPDYNENSVKLETLPGFDAAVKRSISLSRDGDIVLMSPACTSFGEFNNFEERGERFRLLINQLVQ